ncbi:MAG TPA: hypothetical protein VF335_04420, partial [Chitinivibrionales bacterium]
NKILSQPSEPMLKYLLKKLSWESRNAKTYDNLIGIGTLLFFYNSERNDNMIQRHFANDSVLLHLFFGANSNLPDFGWFYNRPDCVKWSLLINQINKENKDRDLSEKIDSLFQTSRYKNALINPFESHNNKGNLILIETIVAPLKTIERGLPARSQ